VHNLVLGVVRADGRLVAADSWEWFRRDAALEGGALFRAEVADALVRAGWAVRSGTGDRGRYFEVEGVPGVLCQVFSPRSREVAEARAEIERELGVRLQGGALAVLAKETRLAKRQDLDPGELRQVWDALGQEHGFGPGSGSRLRGREGYQESVEERMAQARRVVLAQLQQQGPTVSLARCRALVFEAAAGRLSADEATRLLARMESSNGGELLVLDGGRVTSREIRELEAHVIDVAVRAAGNEAGGDAGIGAAARAAGVAAAEEALGGGRRLDREQREAVEVLTGDSGWACLTGRAGTGKGPTLHAAAEAYRASGWRVIACGMDGTTARRMAQQLGGWAPALTVEQLKVRLEAGSVSIDAHTVIFIDEASKLDAGHWSEIAHAVQHHGARVRAVGHEGQHEAIRLPGLFSEMLRQPQIPKAELRQIRRHRDPSDPSRTHPWLRDYQVALDEGRGSDAVAILQERQALLLYGTRAQAMGGMVEEWYRWRHLYPPSESALIVHGPNTDVDLVNELAQHKRLQAGELGQPAIRAVDRDYLLRPGDVVAVRGAAYTFEAEPGGPPPKRIENGQLGIVESVDPERDTLTLLLREPGADPRLAEIDQSRLRGEHAAGQRAAAVRLNYAMHSFPAQGATVHGTATLAGHWSQAKHETYVADTRAVYQHSVHIAREDLGLQGTDEDRLARYAQRISENRERQASIRHAIDARIQLTVDLPDQEPILGQIASIKTSTEAPKPPVAQPSAGHVRRASSPHAQLGHERARLRQDVERLPAEPTEQLVGALGQRPEEWIAQERWEREARRLEALGLRIEDGAQPAWPPLHPRAGATPAPRAPASSIEPPRRLGGPATRR
jgi:hypothetical protein